MIARNFKAGFASVLGALLLCSIAYAGHIVEAPLVDGMTIETSNDIAAVKVRAKSQGPGTCAVKVSTNTGREIGFNALPAKWSPWTELEGALGHVTLTLNTEIDCSTGALFEVQYSAPD